MPESLAITIMTIGGFASMGAIAFFFIKTIINTTNYANKKNQHN